MVEDTRVTKVVSVFEIGVLEEGVVVCNTIVVFPDSVWISETDVSRGVNVVSVVGLVFDVVTGNVVGSIAIVSDIVVADVVADVVAVVVSSVADDVVIISTVSFTVVYLSILVECMQIRVK